MTRKILRHGYSTGATAAAAARGATLALFGRETGAVSLPLPWGSEDAKEVSFKLTGTQNGMGWSSCGVFKDGGDDHPDVTNGMEIRATVAIAARGGDEVSLRMVEIEGGEGIGRVTKPGLAVKPGDPAINPVPRRMIEEAVRSAALEAGMENVPLRVTISAPEGVERSKRTMNAQLGIIGGISILGTTGIVIPMSASAWMATIAACLDVAKASGQSRALLAFGRTSENAGKKLFPELRDNAAVIMGDHVGFALDEAAKRGLSPVVVGQFAKFCKVAGGNLQTHVRNSTLDLLVVKELMDRAGFPPEEAKAALGANTARQLYDELAARGDRGVFSLLTGEVAKIASKRVNGGVDVEAVLFDYSGNRLSRASIRGESRK
ncbi:cobalamin biosynthesis protein CbiD [bacterium]|nr:MAG: cobalamin biosynthesis protein CbiD [bacterium]